MNQTQKTIAAIGLAALALVCLFPPYQHVGYQAFYLVFAPPSYSPGIEVAQLLLMAGAIVLLTVAMILVLGRR